MKTGRKERKRNKTRTENNNNNNKETRNHVYTHKNKHQESRKDKTRETDKGGGLIKQCMPAKGEFVTSTLGAKKEKEEEEREEEEGEETLLQGIALLPLVSRVGKQSVALS